MVGFVDAEGQGDRDTKYDSKLVSPVLLMSKVVLFNWKAGVLKDEIINRLACIAMAANGIDTEEREQGGQVFGHLHIVFRDWNFAEKSKEDVYKAIFQMERGRSEDMQRRNLARRTLEESFESITIWLLPPPVVKCDKLSEKIPFDELVPAFTNKVSELRDTICKQLSTPMVFNGKPLTGESISHVVPLMVEALNKDEIILPKSMYDKPPVQFYQIKAGYDFYNASPPAFRYSSMLHQKALQVKEEEIQRLKKTVDDLLKGQFHKHACIWAL